MSSYQTSNPIKSLIITSFPTILISKSNFLYKKNECLTDIQNLPILSRNALRKHRQILKGCKSKNISMTHHSSKFKASRYRFDIIWVPSQISLNMSFCNGGFGRRCCRRFGKIIHFGRHLEFCLL